MNWKEVFCLARVFVKMIVYLLDFATFKDFFFLQEHFNSWYIIFQYETSCGKVLERIDSPKLLN